MRILTLSNVPLQERLGSGYVILGYAKGLRQRGHHVDVLGPELLERWKFLKRGKLQRLAWGMRSYAAQHAARGQYDVVVLSGGQTCRAASYLNRMKQRDFLMVAHSNGIEMHFDEVISRYEVDNVRARSRWTDLPVERAFKDVDGIVTVSSYDLDFARNHKLRPEGRLRFLRNPLPDSFLGFEVSFAREPVIGFVSSWQPRKGVKVIEAALPSVLRRFKRARFRIVGVEESFRKEQHFPADVLDRIEVLPPVSDREELKRLYRGMAILVMPSHYESFGMVASEAMACGSALVATRTGFAAELKDGEEALLLERADESLLENALTRLLEDEALRQRIAHSGWQRVQGLRWDRAVEQLEEIYLGWLGEIRRDRRMTAKVESA